MMMMTMMVTTGLWTAVLKFAVAILVLWDHVTKFRLEGGVEEDILIGSKAVVVTCQSQGSHALEHVTLSLNITINLHANNATLVQLCVRCCKSPNVHSGDTLIVPIKFRGKQLHPNSSWIHFILTFLWSVTRLKLFYLCTDHLNKSNLQHNYLPLNLHHKSSLYSKWM